METIKQFIVYAISEYLNKHEKELNETIIEDVTAYWLLDNYKDQLIGELQNENKN